MSIIVYNEVEEPIVDPGDLPILALFARGEQGAWYDPSDMSTMFQDAGGTIPVTGVGQPVGLILDKSGNGNHASQTTTTARPTLQQDENGKLYLAFDGVDDAIYSAGSFPISSATGAFLGLCRSRAAAVGTGYTPSLAVARSSIEFMRVDSLRREVSGIAGASVRDDTNFSPAGGYRASLGADSDPVGVLSYHAGWLEVGGAINAQRSGLTARTPASGTGAVNFVGSTVQLGAGAAVAESHYGAVIVCEEVGDAERAVVRAFLERQAGIEGVIA